MGKLLPRLLIAAPGSSGGKTTLVCGLLHLLKQQGQKPAALKCGPDFIDPLFHRHLVPEHSGNLDLFFTGEETVRSLLVKHAAGCDIALLEGVMGFYDGLHSGSTEGSSYHIAKATGTPVILLADPHGASLSIAALVHGFASFRDDANIRGVILNRCSKALYQSLAPAITQSTGLPVLGYLPRDESIAIPSRHLGLTAAGEVADLDEKLSRLSDTLNGTLDLEGLWRIAASALLLEEAPYATAPVTATKPRLAVAQDRAFCFYYQENLKMLEELGAQLVFFSPLEDSSLPSEVHGLYLGGGYPELYAGELSRNTPMLQALRNAVRSGVPTVAECGGFLYLQQGLEDTKGTRWPMVGSLEGSSKRETGLKRFGYITLTARQNNLYCGKGEQIRAHEFHYWHSTYGGDSFAAHKPYRNVSWSGIVARENLIAGFPHCYYPANPSFAQNFVRAVTAYQEEHA